MTNKVSGLVLFSAAIFMFAAFLFFRRAEHPNLANAGHVEAHAVNAEYPKEIVPRQVPSVSNNKSKLMHESSPDEAESDKTTNRRTKQPLFAALIRGNSLNASAAEALIQGSKFDAAIDALARASDAESLEQANHYRKELSANLELANEGLSIRDLACGSSICMASVQDSGDHASSLMAATTSMPEDLPMSSAIFYTIPDPLQPRATVQRLIFSSNRQVRSITVPR